jgi:hypothetical protein
MKLGLTVNGSGPSGVRPCSGIGHGRLLFCTVAGHGNRVAKHLSELAQTGLGSRLHASANVTRPGYTPWDGTHNQPLLQPRGRDPHRSRVAQVRERGKGEKGFTLSISSPPPPFLRRHDRTARAGRRPKLESAGHVWRSAPDVSGCARHPHDHVPGVHRWRTGRVPRPNL